VNKHFPFGKIWFPIILAAFGGLITFAANIGHNLLTTSLLRSVYSFVCLFVLAFPLQFVLGRIAGAGESPQTEPDLSSAAGRHIDLTTPEDPDAPLASRAKPEQASFVPLQFPNQPNSPNPDAQAVIRAIRHMKDE